MSFRNIFLRSWENVAFFVFNLFLVSFQYSQECWNEDF